MAKFVMLNARIYASGSDLTGQSTKIELPAQVDDKETTPFGLDGWKEYIGGLKSFEVSLDGQYEAGDAGKIDDSRWAALGVAADPWTVYPAGSGQAASAVADYGDLAYLSRALETSYTIGGSVGDVAPAKTSAKGNWPLARGISLHPPATARTATGSATVVNGGSSMAVATGKCLYANLHVLSIAGTSTPTITVLVKSDATGAFAGAETTRISFTAATAVGGESLRLAGPITDQFYRVYYTISGTNPSFLFNVSVGVA